MKSKASQLNEILRHLHKIDWDDIKRRFDELVASGVTKETAFDTAVIENLEKRLAACESSNYEKADGRKLTL